MPKYKVWIERRRVEVGCIEVEAPDPETAKGRALAQEGSIPEVEWEVTGASNSTAEVEED